MSDWTISRILFGAAGLLFLYIAAASCSTRQAVLDPSDCETQDVVALTLHYEQRVSLECPHDANGKPVPDCPLLAEFDRKLDEACPKP